MADTASPHPSGRRPHFGTDCAGIPLVREGAHPFRGIVRYIPPFVRDSMLCYCFWVLYDGALYRMATYISEKRSKSLSPYLCLKASTVRFVAMMVVAFWS